MPNWCNNTVSIFGPDNVLADIGRRIQGIDTSDNDGLFSEFVKPDPNHEGDSIMPGWYVANCEAWGTKWDVSAKNIDMTLDQECISLRFSTAWAPPFAFFLSFSELYPQVRVDMTYVEYGMCFGGAAVFWNGQYVNEEVNLEDGIPEDYEVTTDEEWDAEQARIEAMLDAAYERADERYLEESRQREWGE